MLSLTDWAKDYDLPYDVIKDCMPISGIFDLQPLYHSWLQLSLKLTDATILSQSPMLQLPKIALAMLVSVGGDESAAFDDFANQHLQLSQSKGKEEKIKRLLRGVSDYFVSDYFDAIRLLDKERLTQKIVALPFTIAHNPVYFAMSRNSACTDQEEKVFALLKRFKQDGTLAQK